MPSTPNPQSAPNPQTAPAVEAPSDIDQFYQSLYKLAQLALKADNPLPSNPSDTFKSAVCATIWGLPIQQFWEKQGIFTNKGSSFEGKTTAVNTFANASDIDTSSTVVSPNTAVLYSNGFLDLANQYVTVTYPTPRAENIYSMIQVIDPFTNVPYSDGSAYAGSEEERSVIFYWSGASDAVVQAAKGAATETVQAFGLTHPQAWLLGRVNTDPYLAQTSSTETTASETPYQQINPSQQLSIGNIDAQNNIFQIVASDALGSSGITNYATSNVTTEAETANDFFTQLSNAIYNNNALYDGSYKIPVWYLGTTNGELNQSGTQYNQNQLFSQFGSGQYSIGLSATNNEITYTNAPANSDISNGYAQAIKLVDLLGANSNARSSNNYWAIKTNLGQYLPSYQKTNPGWLTAATVANIGLGANIAADGTYPSTTVAVTSSGTEQLNGMNDYQITFSPKDNTFIPIEQPGFWSLTPYNSENEIIPTNSNALNTFYLNSPGDPTTGVYALGSNQFSFLSGYSASDLSLTLSATQTTQAADQYWLPTPSNDNFNVILRLYNPTPASNTANASILSSSNAWTPPAINKQTTTTNGPLQYSNVFHFNDDNLKHWSDLQVVQTNRHGQYTQKSLPNHGTLILREGRDAITGEKYGGLLLAHASSSVISPLSTLDWALEKNGTDAVERDAILDALINNVYCALTGKYLSQSGNDLNSVREWAPHQVIRAGTKESAVIAKSQTIANKAIGSALADKWGSIHNPDSLNMNELKKFKQAVADLATDLKEKSNNFEISFGEGKIEAALNAFSTGSGDYFAALKSFASELDENTDFHAFNKQIHTI